MRPHRLFLLAACALAPLAAQTRMDPFFQPAKIRTLILSGRNNHDWRSTTPFLKKVLTDTGKFDVRVVDEPSGLSMRSLMPYDLIVLDYCGPRWGQEAENAVGSAVRTGKGLVAIHAASYAFGELEVLADNHRRTGLREEPWRDYFEMIGARWVEGPAKSGHGKRHVFEVKFQDPEHPIAKGMSPSFLISDELYHNLETKDGIQVLASAYSDPATGGTGEDEPLLWTLIYGQGRVFHTALGHDLAAMQADGFVTTLARGAEWAATGNVTLPPSMRAETPKTNPVRVELVIGGHDFAPSLFEVFDGRPDLETNVVYQPDAYTAGRLDRTDVVVQYDMMQPIKAEHQANLRRHLESGKGLVVLHHALASYQDWRWWWEEVVGARYVLNKTAEFPPSTYQHDVWLKTETVAEHRITQGVPPMYIYDETYKTMWFSPKIKVLIKTNHETSDGPLVWIGPYEKARVAVIQLGHGTEAHRHPHFQRLVHNAILWAAARE